MTLSNTPRSEAIKGLKESLGKLAELQRSQFVELENLQIKHSREWDKLADGGDVTECESCQKMFARNAEEIKTHQFECVDCRPQEDEEDSDRYLADWEEYQRELSRQIF